MTATLLGAPSASAAVCPNPNPVVNENQCQSGTSNWWVSDYSSNVAGFPADHSVDLGDPVTLKIARNAPTFPATTANLSVYRMGYYGGIGARLIHSKTGVTINNTFTCNPMDETTGKVDCDNWSPTYTIPGSAFPASGVYLAKVTTSAGEETQIVFTVRDDSRAAKLLYVLPTADYTAYNTFGGKSVYFGLEGGNTVSGTGRAVKVSFNRPFSTVGREKDWLFGPDYDLIYWLERQGYDVAYTEDVDVHRNPGKLLQHDAIAIPGHSEYWSAEEYNGVKAARDAGVNVASFGANNAYWKVRYEDNEQTLVCYKTVEGGGSSGSGTISANDWGPDGKLGTADDALGLDGKAGTADDKPQNATTTWRDNGAPAGDPNAPPGGRVGPDQPENQLWGVMYFGDNDSTDFPLTVPAGNANDEFASDRTWRNTGISTNTSTNMGTQVVGWEWDAVPTQAQYLSRQPAGVKRVSATNVQVQSDNSWLQDEGRARATTPPPGMDGKVQAVKYTAPSGALVFAAGTNQWGLGLNEDEDPRIQQATYNILSDMGLQPDTPDGVTTDPGGSNKAPVASFTISKNPTKTNTSITFDAAASKDLDGSIAKYEWDLDGNGSYEVNGGLNPVTSRSYTAEGDYTVRLRVTDNGGATDLQVKTLTIIDNQPPTAAFTLDPSPAIVGQTVTANGSSSSDSDGTIAKYEWDFDGNGSYEVNAGASATTTTSFASPGTRTVGLRVTDSGGKTATKTAPITVNNGGISNYGDAVLDTPGLVSYWRMGETAGSVFADSKGTSPATAFGGPQLGVQGGPPADPNGAARFDGIDDNAQAKLNLSSTDKITVEFWANWTFANDDRLAMELTPSYHDNNGGFLIDPNAPQLGGKFAIGIGRDGSRNTAFFDRPSSGAWHHYAFVLDASAPAASQITPYVDGLPVAYTKENSGTGAGKFANSTLYLMSRAGAGLFGTGDLDEVAIYNRTLSAAEVAEHAASYGTNRRPVSSFTVSPNPVAPAQQATFNGSGSSDPDGSIVKYEWDLDGNGSFETNTGSTPTATKTYAAEGDVSVKLRVTDNLTGTDVETTNVHVIANQAPTASFSANPNPAVLGQTTSFDAGASKDGDGSIVKYEWDLDGNGSFETDSGSKATTTRQYATTGTTNVSLRVTDNGGKVATAAISVAVFENGVSNYGDTVQDTPGLVSYWRLGESSGTTFANGKAGASAATATGGVTMGVPGAVLGDTNLAARFDGVDDAANAPINLSGTSKVTVEFWLNWSAYANDDRLAMELTDNFNENAGGFIVDPNAPQVGAGSFGVGIGTGGTRNDAFFARPSAGDWHHYAFVLDSTAPAAEQVIPYVDGKAVSYTKLSTSASAGAFANAKLNLMSRAGSSLFGNGDLDEVAIYDRTLSAGTIAEHFASYGSNRRPTAKLNATPNPAQIGQTASFSAAGSNDPDGSIVKYEWDLDGNGSYETDTGTTPTTSRSYNTAGSVDAKVRVYDNQNGTDTETVTLTVGNNAPTASFTATPNPVVVGGNVALNASASSDDAGIVKYEWDLDGNGSYEKDTGTTATTATSYASAGPVEVGLRVTDGLGLTATTTRTVTVAAANQPPTASFTASPEPAGIGETVSFNGSASADVDGPIAKYEWDLDGNGSYETDTGATPTTTRAYAAAGTVSVGLRVTDGSGDTGTTTQPVHVNGSGSDYASKVLATGGLMHYWRMGDAAGGTLADAKGSSPATIAGGPALGAPGGLVGDADTAVSFDGLDDGAAAPVDLSGTNKVTLEFWLKWDAFADDDDLAFELTDNFNGNAGGLLVDPNAPQSGGQFGVAIGNGASRNSAYFVRPSAGAWHHYALVLDTSAPAAQQITPYVDGLAVPFNKANSGTGAGNFANSSLYFMSRAAASLFGSGDLDEVALYGRALTAAEVGDHYSSVVNAQPNASFTVTPASVDAKQNVTLDASGSKDPDGTIAKYEWDLDGNGSYEVDGGATATRTTSWATTGVKTVGLRVTDKGGATGTTTRDVTVTPEGEPPTASFTVAPDPALVGQTVTFNGSASADVDGPIAKYEWDLDGNGSYETDTGTTATATRAYAAAGSVTVALRVTDGGTETATTTRELHVNKAGESYAAKVLGTSGLLSYWRMGDAAGGTLADAKGSSPATISGGPALGAPGGVVGDSDTAVSFDGADDGASAALNLSSTNKLTLEFWLKWDAFANDDDLAFELTPNFNSTAGGLLVDPNAPQSGGQFGIGIGSGAARNTAYFTRPSAGAWHHYALVLDTSAPAAQQITPYVDGVAVPFTKPNNGTGAGNFANSSLYFMSRAAASLFGSGDLDEVAVYTRALAAAEVADHFGSTAANNAPTASFTVAPTPANVGQTVTLDGSASADSDGTIAKYEWDLDGNGSYEVDAGTTATRTTSFATTGAKTLGLRVTDNKGATATTTRNLTVQNAPSPPTASFTATPQTVASGGSVSFDGSASSDADGPIAKYEWDLDGNGSYETSTGTTATTTRVFPTAGTVTVKLRVTDGSGATAETSKAITVTNKAPTAAFTVTPSPAATRQVVTFSGATSTDSDGTIAKYEWDLDGNGSYEVNGGATATTTKTFSAVGNVTIGLRVTDNSNATATTTKALTVNSAYAASVLGTTGIKGYWRLADTAQTAADASSSNNPGTITNGPVSVAGLLTGETNNARDFDGTNDFVNLSPTPFGSPGSVSAEAWVRTGSKKPTGNYHYVISNSSSDFNNGFTLAIDSSNRATFVAARTLILTTRGQATSSVTLDPNTTHHIVGTYDGSRVRVYVDGVERGNVAFSGGITYDSGRDINIGRKVASASQASNYFDGIIDEPALYTTALSAANVTAHYNAGKP